MVTNDASKWHILHPAQSHTAGQDGGRAQQRLPPPQLACAQQSARCGGRLGVYYTFWRVSGAGPSTSCPAGTHMLPGEQGSGVCAKSGVLKQARRAPRRPDSSERRIDRDNARRRASPSVRLERRAWADATPDLAGPRAGLHPATCRPAGWWPAELRAPPKLAALRRTILLSS